MKVSKMCQGFCLTIGTIFATLINIPISIALPLSPGDRLEVSIPNEKYFTRTYEVNQNGELEIPYLGSLEVIGLEPKEVEEKLKQKLTIEGFFPANNLQLTVQVLKWAPVLVAVSGEVFQPGRVLVNPVTDPKETHSSPETNQVTGEYQPRRYITSAVQATGGVLPTADVTKILLQRGNQEILVDLSGAFTGEPIDDIPLIAGDRIIVPTGDRFQPELMRSSLITPPGMKIFVSNLTIPASSNSTSAIGNLEEGIAMPYGARFNQGVIAANCVGGTQLTNAHRQAVLLRVNRLTGETTYFQRPVEDIIRKSHDDRDNPFLMPRDGIACYDSNVTNIRDILKTLMEFLNPLTILQKMLTGSSK